jgi:hypothetical protein
VLDGDTHRRVLCAPNDELRARILAWARGQPVEPARFTLELPG